MERIVDTHTHFWTLATTTWVDESYGPMHRDFLPTDHRAESAACGVTRCVIVEAGSSDRENQLIAEIAGSDDFVGALILHAPLDDPDLGHKLDEWQQIPKFRGTRMMFEPIEDADIAARPAIVEGLKELARRDLVHDFLPLIKHLQGVAEALDQVPDLRCIIEHLAKPNFDGTFEQDWTDGMRRLVEDTACSFKLSLSPQVTRVAEYVANPGQGWPISAIQPYYDFLRSEAGSDRLIWGSDWPVAVLSGSYRDMLDTHRELLGDLDEVTEMKLFRRNAEELYQLEA